MAAPSTCVVYCYLEDILGSSVTGATFSTEGGSFKYGTQFITQSSISVPFNASGYAALTVIETQTPGVYYNFSIEYPISKSFNQINFGQVIVPNSGVANIATIASFRGY